MNNTDKREIPKKCAYCGYYGEHSNTCKMRPTISDNPSMPSVPSTFYDLEKEYSNGVGEQGKKEHDVNSIIPEIMNSQTQEDALIDTLERLGEVHGYGHSMSILSSLWRKNLKDKGYPVTGAFVPTILNFIKIPHSADALNSANHYDELIQKKKQ